jgi:glycosyltransferase involved in cell wall biosynthesis
MVTAIQPLVSIVVPSFNQASFLEATLDSLLSQDYPRLETLVIDGGSTDGSMEILRRYAPRLSRWISEPDAGQADAIDKGLRMATGEIVAWLNSDDLYLPGAVSAAVRALETHPEAVMVYADGVLIDEATNLLDWHRYRQYGLLDLLCFNVLLQPTVFIRRDALEKVGLLRKDFHLILDHELWVRLAAQGSLLHVPAFWAAERTHPEAKTVAAAAEFVAEAQQLMQEAEASSSLREVVAAHKARVTAGLEAFCGRRLIDARQYPRALRHFARSLRADPRLAFRYWYKILQAGMGAIGLEGVFLWYRRARRRVQHSGVRLNTAGGLVRPKQIGPR